MKTGLRMPLLIMDSLTLPLVPKTKYQKTRTPPQHLPVLECPWGYHFLLPPYDCAGLCQRGTGAASGLRGPSEAVGPTTLRSPIRGFPAESSGDIRSGLWSSEIWLLFLPSWVCFRTALSSHAADIMSPNKHPGF